MVLEEKVHHKTEFKSFLWSWIVHLNSVLDWFCSVQWHRMLQLGPGAKGSVRWQKVTLTWKWCDWKELTYQKLLCVICVDTLGTVWKWLGVGEGRKGMLMGWLCFFYEEQEAAFYWFAPTRFIFYSSRICLFTLMSL